VPVRGDPAPDGGLEGRHLDRERLKGWLLRSGNFRVDAGDEIRELPRRNIVAPVALDL
jgi:hypothetical protein